MSLHLYNTLSRKLEEFSPLIPGQASLYCCGPTVYNYAHIGNLRTYIFEDILRRTLQNNGYTVKHVMNVTDVGHLSDDGDEGEDKMIRSAREKGMSVWDISRMFTDAFFNDTDRLNLLRPQVSCKASDHIQEMIQMISGLEAGGFTYQAGGNVYFDTAHFPQYGQMAMLDKQVEATESRVETDLNKKNSRDFVLWFTQSKFEGQSMLWDSPWGRGYPGWHIECSAMATKYLGERVDIHCGGVDHVSVHHTNEIAQSEAFCGHKWVNYWVHGEFLILQKAKMSKSSGTFLTIQSLIDQGYDPLDYRYFTYSGHYRTQLTFTFEALDGARSARRNLNEKVLSLKGLEKNPLMNPQNSFLLAFFDSINNDLNLPQALAQVWLLLKDTETAPAEKLGTLYAMDQILALGLESLVEDDQTLPPEIQDLLELRKQARINKDWAGSDKIRAQIATFGWIVEDGPGGQKIKKNVPL